MKLGVCAGIDQAEKAAQAGWDYLEISVGTLVPREPEEVFTPVLDRLRGSPIPIEAANCFLPGDLKLTGPEVDLSAVLAYVDVALRRMAAVGIQVVVLGSGGARNRPEGWSLEHGLDQLADFLSQAGPLAAAQGVTIAVEPLRAAESNIVNRLADAVELCQRVGHAAVQPLADFFHMAEEGEPLSAVEAAAGRLAHVHVADSGRRAPGTGSVDFPALFATLRGIGYTGRVSAECGWEDFETQQTEALACLRRAAAEPG